MSHEVRLSPAVSNSPLVTVPSAAALGTSLERRPAAAVVPPLSAAEPGARRAMRADRKRQARRGTCQASPATPLTAIDLPGTSDIPGIDLAQTLRRHRAQVSTATTPVQPILPMWRSFENLHGPIRAVITFVLVAPIALLGLKRTAAAGVLLLVVGVVPLAVSSLGSLLGFASLSVVSSAPIITGIFYLVSARIAGWPAPPARAGTGPAEQPKAA